MKIMSTWTVRPGCKKEAISQFMTSKGAAPEGVKLLGRWHNTDGSGGFFLAETDNPSALYEGSNQWADLVDFHGHTVVEDAEAAAVLAKMFGK
jgi:hypothetical protein